MVNKCTANKTLYNEAYDLDERKKSNVKCSNWIQWKKNGSVEPNQNDY